MLIFSRQLLLVISIFFVVASCANYQLNYAESAAGWTAQEPQPDADIQHQVFLVGNMGDVNPSRPGPAVAGLRQALAQAGENSTLVFLGNNVPRGGYPFLPDSSDIFKARDRLDLQINLAQSFAGDVYFIAGNQDWAAYGLAGLKAEAAYIENKLGREEIFLPRPGCGDPQEIELTDNLVLVLIDSQWWLGDWTGQKDINSGCEVKSRNVFQVFVEEAIKGNRSKNVLVALHHPPYANGQYAGDYPLNDHLFPLTRLHPALYLPLPVIGTLGTIVRTSAGGEQYAVHPSYRDLSDLLISSARKNGRFIFASAHERNLQYLERDDQYFIVSGAAGEVSATRVGQGVEFAYAQQGYSRIDFYPDGASWVNFFAVHEDTKEVELVFRKEMRSGEAFAEAPADSTFTDLEALGETKRIRIGQIDFSRNELGRFFWGDHYRDVYATEIDAPVMLLDTFAGGHVVPVKRGGGYQTNSLRLEDTLSNKQYTMRSIDKDATRTVPYPFNRTFVLDIFRDNFSAAHPLGALPLPALSDAAGIFHTNPQLYYVPKQPLLGKYNDGYGDALYLMEVRPDDEAWGDVAHLGHPPKIESSSKVVEEIIEDQDKKIDYDLVARARLFDILIGDWDRHEDQWRWGEQEKGEWTYYQPIPRDRDQAFSKYDGFVPWLGRGILPFIKQLRVYEDDLGPIKWAKGNNARQFDPTYTAELERIDWLRQARHLQQTLTDSVIEQAFREAWPPAVFEMTGPDVIAGMKWRRDHLIEIANDLYEFLSREVDVVGTEDEDYFLIERLSKDSTRVRVWDWEEGEVEELLFERTFDNKHTKEIRLYGMQDDDRFQVEGEVGSGVKVRIIGGLGADTTHNASRVRGLAKKTKVYDSVQEENVVTGNRSDTRLKISPDPRYNTYNRKAVDYEYDFSSWLPSVGVNPDDGVLLGLSFSHTNYGFKKSPYASRHQIDGQFAFATSGFAIDYFGQFIDVVGKWELGLNARYQSPLYAINFYGFGNQTENLEEEFDRDYNRVRQRLIQVSPMFMRRFDGNGFFAIGPEFESIRVEDTDGRFIGEIAPSLSDPEIFEGLEFLGVRARLELGSINEPAFPDRGLRFVLEGGYKAQIDDDNYGFPYIRSALSLYQRIDPEGRLVFATRVGVDHIFDNDFVFYQGATLGGQGDNSNFRGFRRERFTGKTAFYHNIDLRWRGPEILKNVLPSTFGLLAGFDYGRVWLPEEDSDLWHYSYGGGVFISPFDIFAMNLDVFVGDGELTRVTVGGNFFF